MNKDAIELVVCRVNMTVRCVTKPADHFSQCPGSEEIDGNPLSLQGEIPESNSLPSHSSTRLTVTTRQHMKRDNQTKFV
jgi:hypothetical protein